MSEWGAGYVTDIDYTFGYYGQTNPARIRLAFLAAGLLPPVIGTACELGFGQGIGVNAHAAATVTQWHGTDFTPAQAGFAQQVAAVAGAGARLYDESFEQFAARTDLPDFDFICLHGIWSWVSDANRAIIVDFIGRKLKVGGVVFVSYNAMPGWSRFAPIRHLIARHAEVAGDAGHGVLAKMTASLDFAGRLFATEPRYARVTDGAAARIGELRQQNPRYLAHEYLNRNWQPMYFAEVEQWLAPAKLDFACSAYFSDQLDVLNLTGEQQAALQAIPHPGLRESARDFMVNRQFRSDYWVKGARHLVPLEQAEALHDERIVLVVPRAAVPMTIGTPLGEAALAASVYGPILDVLGDNLPHTLGDIAQRVAGAQIGFAQLLQAVLVLAGADQVMAAQDDATIAAVRERCRALNRHLMGRARFGDDIGVLASAVVGGGINVGRIEQLFLLSIANGASTPEAWATFATSILAAQRETLVKGGRPIEGAERNAEEMRQRAESFATARLPLLRALEIA